MSHAEVQKNIIAQSKNLYMFKLTCTEATIRIARKDKEMPAALYSIAQSSGCTCNSSPAVGQVRIS